MKSFPLKFFTEEIAFRQKCSSNSEKIKLFTENLSFQYGLEELEYFNRLLRFEFLKINEANEVLIITALALMVLL